MNKPIEVTNELIAEFIQYEREGIKYFIPEHGYIKSNGDWKDTFEGSELKYNKSWDWLMPVVNKIELQSKEIFDNYEDVIINGCSCLIELPEEYKNINVIEDCKIKAVYNAVVQYVEWYNENYLKNGN